MMKIHKIITTEDSLEQLREVSRKLSMDEIKSKEIQDFIDDLIHTATHAKLQAGWESAGLAAVQIGKPIAIFVARDLETDEFKAYINPEVEYITGSKDIQLEGCLSIPYITGKVERPKRVKIKYIDRYGNTKKEKLYGFSARIVQHEYDHLLGELFIDKMI